MGGEIGYEDFQATVEPDAINWVKRSHERQSKQWLNPSKERLDPMTFAVILSKLQYIAFVIKDVMLMLSRSGVLNVTLDFSTGILDRNGNTLVLPDLIPGLMAAANLGLVPIIDAYEGDIKPGDLFINNSYYEGCAHIPEINVYCPVFYKDELLFWTFDRPHHNDIGCYLPTGMNVWAKDVYEEGLHLPPYRIARNWKLDEHFHNLLYRNIRYPKMFRADHLAVTESVWAGEKKLIELIEKYKADTIKQWQDEWQDCGDRRTVDEIRKLPKGTWYFEGTSDSFYPFAPNGATVRGKMTIDPDEARIHYDLTESDDQVEGGINCCPASALAGATTGTLFCLNPTLPRNQGSYNHVTVELRKGSIFWVTFPHAATACTTILRDRLVNGIMETFAEIDPKRGHAACGYEGTSDAYFAGVDPKRNEPYQVMPFVALSGGCASYGYDGWPGFIHAGTGGGEPSTPVEVHELRYPHLIREIYLPKDSGGYGQWIGGPGGRWTLEPIGHNAMVSAFGDGIERAADGVLGGGDGMQGWHRIVDAKTGEHIATLGHKSFYTVKQGQMWEGGVQGGGGFGDPLDRDPEKVRWDAREERISLRAAREVYGVVLNTEPELYEVDYEATRKLREDMKKIPLEERKKGNDQIMMETRAEDGIPLPSTEEEETKDREG